MDFLSRLEKGMTTLKVNKKRRFYNLSEQSKKITELINNGQIRLAREIVLELMNKYPKDEILKVQFARINILEKNYEEALIILEQLNEKKVFLKLVSLATIYLIVSDLYP